MAHYLLPFLFISVTSILSAQTFTILKQRGQVLNQNTRQYLQEQDSYQGTDILEFSHSSDRLLVDNQDNDLFLVSPTTIDGKLMPQYQALSAYTQGRPGKITSSIGLIQHINETEPYLILGGACHIAISPYSFPVNADTVFYIRYLYEGETVDKILPYDNGVLSIAKNHLFQAKYYADEKYGVDTTIYIPYQEATQFELGYYDLKNGSSIPFFDPSQADENQYRISIPIQLTFVEDAVLQKEVLFFQDGLNDLFPNLTQRQRLQRLQVYLETAFMGKLEQENLINALKKLKIDY